MTLQQISEKRPRKIDLNLLPPEYRPVKKSKLSLLLALVAILLVCALVPVFIAKTGVDSDIKPLRPKLTSLQSTLQANLANNAEAATIQKQIDDNVAKLAVVGVDYRTFISTRIIWSAILEEINDITPKSKITLDAITLTDISVVFAGTSTKRQYIIDYEKVLEESPFFKGITFSFEDGTDSVSFGITAPFDMSTISSTNNASLNSNR